MSSYFYLQRLRSEAVQNFLIKCDIPSIQWASVSNNPDCDIAQTDHRVKFTRRDVRKFNIWKKESEFDNINIPAE